MTTTYDGYFLIADITGYTRYLSESELDHAQQTLTALLELLIQHTKPPLIISRLAGDAVISYGLQDNFYQGQTLVEMIEDTYVAFRRALERMVLNTTCECKACKNISALDLKFFVHYGTFGIQKLDAHDELVGADVIVIHRLLKNHVTEQTGYPAYTLYTDAAIRQLGLEDICQKMTPHTEAYEHLGEVKTWIQDMHSVWQAKKEHARIQLLPEDVFFQAEAEIMASPELVWDYLIQPQHLNVLIGGTRLEITQRQQGQVQAGSVYQCYHGKTAIDQLILEWQPFERILTECSLPIPVKGTMMRMEFRLEATPNGTRFSQVIGKPTGPLVGRMMAYLIYKNMEKSAQHDMEHFKRHVEENLAARRGILSSSLISAEMPGKAAFASLSHS